jgi:hypothetical protein
VAVLRIATVISRCCAIISGNTYVGLMYVHMSQIGTEALLSKLKRVPLRSSGIVPKGSELNHDVHRSIGGRTKIQKVGNGTCNHRLVH